MCRLLIGISLSTTYRLEESLSSEIIGLFTDCPLIDSFVDVGCARIHFIRSILFLRHSILLSLKVWSNFKVLKYTIHLRDLKCTYVMEHCDLAVMHKFAELVFLVFIRYVVICSASRSFSWGIVRKRNFGISQLQANYNYIQWSNVRLSWDRVFL